VKNPAKKTAAKTETTKTTPEMRRAQTAKWLIVFRRRGGLAKFTSVAKLSVRLGIALVGPNLRYSACCRPFP